MGAEMKSKRQRRATQSFFIQNVNWMTAKRPVRAKKALSGLFQCWLNFEYGLKLHLSWLMWIQLGLIQLPCCEVLGAFLQLGIRLSLFEGQAFLPSVVKRLIYFLSHSSAEHRQRPARRHHAWGNHHLLCGGEAWRQGQAGPRLWKLRHRHLSQPWDQ